MAKKEETPSNDTLTKEDLSTIYSMVIQANIKASDSIIVGAIITKLKNMMK